MNLFLQMKIGRKEGREKKKEKEKLNYNHVH